MGRAHHESSLLRLFSICRTISLFSACLQRLPTFILTRFVWPCDRRLAPSLKFISFFIGSIESLAFNYLVGFGNLARVNGDWSSSHHVILLEVSYHPKGPQSGLGSQLLTSIVVKPDSLSNCWFLIFTSSRRLWYFVRPLQPTCRSWGWWTHVSTLIFGQARGFFWGCSPSAFFVLIINPPRGIS